jgi:hypothetical protein
VFATPEIAEACNSLKAPSDEKPIPPNLEFDSPKEKYSAACLAISTDLVNYATRCVRIMAGALEPTTMVPLIPRPLP